MCTDNYCHRVETIVPTFGDNFIPELFNLLKVRNHIDKNSRRKTDQLSIRKIHHLLIKLRSQATLYGNFLATQQLVSILLTMYATGGSFFVFVTILGDRSAESGITMGETVMMGFASLWPLFGISRLYVKIWMAVTITDEVSGILLFCMM